MKIFSVPTEGCGSNCWLLSAEETNEYVIVDPSPGLEICSAFIRSLNLKPEGLKYILLTHGHFDHILGVDELREYTGASVAIHKADSECLTDSAKNLYKLFFHRELTVKPADILLNDGDELFLGNNKIKVMHTPGHSEGSCIYIIGDNMFCGDTIFDLSVGRTDLVGSNPQELQKSLEKIAKIQNDYTLYPGHGNITTLKKQLEYNPYLKGIN